MWKVNTSSLGKLEEFRRFLPGEIEVLEQDLPEPLADPLTIVRYKASQFDNVLVDDTSLNVEDEEIGAEIKWLMERLPSLIGKRAEFVCLLGLRRGDRVHIFEGRVKGRIASKAGEGFGFNSYFVPDGSTRTYAQEKPDEKNARYLAVQKLLKHEPSWIMEPLVEWKGRFQQELQSPLKDNSSKA